MLSGEVTLKNNHYYYYYVLASIISLPTTWMVETGLTDVVDDFSRLSVCIPHRCNCGTTVDVFGTQPLTWDATFVDTCVYESDTSPLAAGSVADAVEIQKNSKYAVLGRRFIFQPVVVDTSAPWENQRSIVKYLGRRLAETCQDQRWSDFLFQRMSLAILRGNVFNISQSCRGLFY